MKNKKHAWKCFCCEKDIVSAMGKEKNFGHDMPPSEATSWITHGNYGTALFDPIFYNANLEIIICDECLAKKSHLAWHFSVLQKSEKCDIFRFDEVLEDESKRSKHLLPGVEEMDRKARKLLNNQLHKNK